MTTIYQYTAEHNPKGASKILNKYGYKSWDKWEMNAKALTELVNLKGEQVLKDIATEHPDFDLIIKHYKAPHIVNGKTVNISEHANCDACNQANCDGDTKCQKCMANADGKPTVQTGPSSAPPQKSTVTETTVKEPSNKIMGLHTETLMNLAIIGILGVIVVKAFKS